MERKKRKRKWLICLLGLGTLLWYLRARRKRKAGGKSRRTHMSAEKHEYYKFLG